MPASLVPGQKNQNGQASGTSVSVGFPGNVTAGNLITVVVRKGTTSETITVTDTLGNTYGAPVAHQTTGEAAALFRVVSASSGANTVQASGSGGSARRGIAIYELTGTDAAPDDDADQATGSGDTSAEAGTIVMTADGAAVSGLALQSSSITVTAPDTGFGEPLYNSVGRVWSGLRILAATTLSPVHTISAAAAWGAVLANFKESSGGGTGHTHNAGGTVTPAGALSARVISKSLAGSITPAGAVATVATRARELTGAVTPAGSPIRDVSTSRAGSIAPAGSTSTVRAVSSSTSGSITPAGTVSAVKAALASLAGSITPAGAVNAVKVLARELGGTITGTGAIARLVDRALGGTVTPAGSSSKSLARTLSGALGLAGTMGRLLTAAVGGTLGLSGAVATLNVVTRSLAGAMGLSGAITRLVGKGTGGTVTPAGAILRRDISAVLSNTLAPVGTLALVRSIVRSLAGALGLSGTVDAGIEGQNLLGDTSQTSARSRVPRHSARRVTSHGTRSAVARHNARRRG